MTNYDLFLKTVNNLKYSQGFYSRLARDLNNMSDRQREDLINYLNQQPEFKSELDVILFLEQ